MILRRSLGLRHRRKPIRQVASSMLKIGILHLTDPRWIGIGMLVHERNIRAEEKAEIERQRVASEQSPARED